MPKRVAPRFVRFSETWVIGAEYESAVASALAGNGAEIYDLVKRSVDGSGLGPLDAVREFHGRLEAVELIEGFKLPRAPLRPQPGCHALKMIAKVKREWVRRLRARSA